MKIFIDTNAWIAINSKSDQFHNQAIQINKHLLANGNRYITTNYILDETYTGLLMKVGHFAAVDFGEKIRLSKLIEVISIKEKDEELAWELFKKYFDKQFSFTDCTSFIIMQQMNVSEAFTNDHHFEQMGFEILLK